MRQFKTETRDFSIWTQSLMVILICKLHVFNINHTLICIIIIIIYFCTFSFCFVLFNHSKMHVLTNMRHICYCMFVLVFFFYTGTTGARCETDDNSECTNSTCINGGVCINKINSFTCICPVKYKGPK